MSKKVNLHYVITNGGDGSASVHFVKNAKEAQIYDDFRQFHEGWGEGEAFHEELEIDKDGNVLTGLTDVREALENVINEPYYQKDKAYVKACKDWLKELDEA